MTYIYYDVDKLKEKDVYVDEEYANVVAELIDSRKEIPKVIIDADNNVLFGNIYVRICKLLNIKRILVCKRDVSRLDIDIFNDIDEILHHNNIVDKAIIINNVRKQYDLTYRQLSNYCTIKYSYINIFVNILFLPKNVLDLIKDGVFSITYMLCLSQMFRNPQINKEYFDEILQNVLNGRIDAIELWKICKNTQKSIV